MSASSQSDVLRDREMNADTARHVQWRNVTSRLDALVATGYGALERNDPAFADFVLSIAIELAPNASSVATLKRAIDAHRSRHVTTPSATRVLRAVLLFAIGVSSVFVIDRTRSAPVFVTDQPRSHAESSLANEPAPVTAQFSAVLTPLMRPVHDARRRVPTARVSSIGIISGAAYEPLRRRSAP